MTKLLSDRTREIVKACVPALEQHGLDITHEMYKRLLSDAEIRDLFNMSHQKDGEQPKALALAVLAYARHIDNPDALKAMLERIAEKHVGLNILPKHYPFVGKVLLGAISHVLGEAATPEIMNAWTEAYNFLAELLINREATIYQEHESHPGGWKGWRRFKISDRHQENQEVITFTLIPEDGKAVMRHKAGQYLSFKFTIPEHGSQRRNYTISSKPCDDHYQITVKRHDVGVISNWLHHSCPVGTIIDVSAPAGDFTLNEMQEKPVLFLSAGVGATPMISMLETLVAHENHPPIRYVHSAHNSERDIFANRIKELCAHGHMKADFFYTIGIPTETFANITFHNGRISPEWLKTELNRNTIYYICGPDDFMRETIKLLKAHNLPDDHIRYEMFGSASDAYLSTGGI